MFSGRSTFCLKLLVSRSAPRCFSLPCPASLGPVTLEARRVPLRGVGQEWEGTPDTFDDSGTDLGVISIHPEPSNALLRLAVFDGK